MMDEEETEYCADCRFWINIPEGHLHKYEIEGLGGESIGQCRRFPPQVNGYQVYKDNGARILKTHSADSDGENLAICDASTFPITMSWEWCGEFQN